MMASLWSWVSPFLPGTSLLNQVVSTIDFIIQYIIEGPFTICVGAVQSYAVPAFHYVMQAFGLDGLDAQISWGSAGILNMYIVGKYFISPVLDMLIVEQLIGGICGLFAVMSVIRICLVIYHQIWGSN